MTMIFNKMIMIPKNEDKYDKSRTSSELRQDKL